MNKLSRKDKKLVDILQESVHRMMELCLKERSPKSKGIIKNRPFFSSLTVKEISDYNLLIINGATMFKDIPRAPTRFLRGQMRLGCPVDGGAVDNIALVPMPMDNNSLAIKKMLWHVTNESMYGLVRDLNTTISESIGVPLKHQPYIYFSDEKPIQSCVLKVRNKLEMDYWENLLKKVCEKLSKEKIMNPNTSLNLITSKRFFVNSEGTVIVDNFTRANITIAASLRCEDNLMLRDRSVSWCNDVTKLPQEETLMMKAEEILSNLFDLEKAPNEKPKAFPTLVDGRNHGNIWHEAFGHGMEAHRHFEDDEEPNIFSLMFGGEDVSPLKDRIGEKILPEFLTIVDDPTLKGQDGSYKYDEDGVKARRVLLIGKGRVIDYLHSRQSAGRFSKIYDGDFKSNGHCRAGEDPLDEPVPRMSNLVVSSSKVYSLDELRAMMFEECERRGLKYGISLEDSSGGETRVEDSYFKEFPRKIFRLYPNGKKVRVRGLFIATNPFELIENIVATGGSNQIFRGQCGAESGYVPVTAIAPSALLRMVGFAEIPRSDYDKCFPFLSKPPKK